MTECHHWKSDLYHILDLLVLKKLNLKTEIPDKLVANISNTCRLKQFQLQWKAILHLHIVRTVVSGFMKCLDMHGSVGKTPPAHICKRLVFHKNSNFDSSVINKKIVKTWANISSTLVTPPAPSHLFFTSQMCQISVWPKQLKLRLTVWPVSETAFFFFNCSASKASILKPSLL